MKQTKTAAALLCQAFQRLRIASPSMSSSWSSSSSSPAALSSRTFSTRRSPMSLFIARPESMASSLVMSSSSSPTSVLPPSRPGSHFQHLQQPRRPFSASAVARGTWLEPSINRQKRMMKGRPRVATGGSVKGTTVVWGDYGLRMRDHHRRISAKQLKVAEDTIKQRLRGQRYRLYKRVNCNIGVFISGNEMRMGKGKGSFDHWVARVAVNRIIFEVRGAIHEQVARDAFRLAGNKLPGQYEFVKKGDPAVVGTTKLADGLTLEELKRPRKAVPAVPAEAVQETSGEGASAGAPPA